MSEYRQYPLHQVLFCRVGVVLLGIVAFPIMIFRHDRSRFYSYLYRMWLKTSDKPVWLAIAEDTESMK